MSHYQDIDRMVMESHYLDSLEREREVRNQADKERQEYLAQINDLKEALEQTRSMYERTKAVNASLQKSNESLQKDNEKLLSLLDNFQAAVANLTRKLQALNDILARMNT